MTSLVMSMGFLDRFDMSTNRLLNYFSYFIFLDSACLNQKNSMWQDMLFCFSSEFNMPMTFKHDKGKMNKMNTSVETPGNVFSTLSG